MRDLVTAQTTLVSQSRTGNSGNGRSLTADCSGDGRVVTFDSDADDLVATDSNRGPDVFTWANTTNAPPQINAVRQSSQGRLIITGENFDAGVKVFVARREVQLSQRASGMLISKTVLLRDGSYGVRVVNADGQAHVATLVVRAGGTVNLQTQYHDR